MEDYAPATRVTGNNAKGNKRRIGKGKKSSLDDADLKPKAKKRKSSAEDGASGKQPASALPTTSGASAFFRNQERGSKGLRRNIQEAAASGEDLRITREMYKGFYEEAREHDPNNVYTDRIASDFAAKNLDRLWTLLSRHNVLVYGLGDKRRLMQSFAQEVLAGEDVVELEGDMKGGVGNTGGGDRGVKALLGHIGKHVLQKRDPGAVTCSMQSHTRLICDLLDVHYGRGAQVATGGSSRTSGGWFNSAGAAQGREWGGMNEKEDDEGGGGGEEAEGGRAVDDMQARGARRGGRMVVQDAHRWGGRYALAQSKLYVVIHDVCGHALSSEASQQCLSVLAACPSVSLLACVENLNSIAVWDRRMLANYRWSFEHVPTYRSFRLPQNHPFFASADVLEAELLQDQADEQEAPEERQGEGEGLGLVEGASGSSAGAKHPSQSAPVGVPLAQTGHSRMAAVTQQQMDVILKSLTKNHNELMEVLVACIRDKAHKERLRLQQLAASSASSRTSRTKGTVQLGSGDRWNAEKGERFDLLLDSLKVKLIVKTDSELHALLKEFVDHKVVMLVPHKNAIHICLKPPFDSIAF
ncbi:origin recognition complex subunit 2-domain-containing protein [Ochromonadaceae sp. CCMP2298]|nr:origin recognition complex subunit 2-domain-containing protein [Ochromonadaceae sp. CCMP2298]